MKNTPYRSLWPDARALKTSPEAFRVVSFCRRVTVLLTEYIVSGQMADDPVPAVRELTSMCYAVVVPTRGKLVTLRWICLAILPVLAFIAAVLAPKLGPSVGWWASVGIGVCGGLVGATAHFAHAGIDHLDAFSKPLDDMKKYCASQPLSTALLDAEAQALQRQLEASNETLKRFDAEIAGHEAREKKAEAEIAELKARAVLTSKPPGDET